MNSASQHSLTAKAVLGLAIVMILAGFLQAGGAWIASIAAIVAMTLVQMNLYTFGNHIDSSSIRIIAVFNLVVWPLAIATTIATETSSPSGDIHSGPGESFVVGIGWYLVLVIGASALWTHALRRPNDNPGASFLRLIGFLFVLSGLPIAILLPLVFLFPVLLVPFVMFFHALVPMLYVYMGLRKIRQGGKRKPSAKNRSDMISKF